MKINNEWKDYQILATGNGEKLERWKDVYLLRPDPQAIWKSQSNLSKFDKLNARYIRSETGGGHWEYLKQLPDSWIVGWRDLRFRVKPMGFKHTGLFPEQAVNWAKMIELIKNANRPINVLNLFAYTGGATVACLSAGAHVCHVDAAKNMVVCAVGNIEHDRFVKMVEQRMNGIQPHTDFVPDEQKYTGGFYAEKRNIEQAHVIMGFKGVPYSTEQYYPIILFSTLFGGGMSSRLFQEIREKRGLVYSVYSFTGSHTQDGVFGIYAGTGGKDLPTLMPVVVEEIKKVCNEKVLQKELDRAKTQLKASMLMSLESSSSVAEVLARQHLIYNRIIPIDEMVERIEKVTLDDIQNVAQTIFSSTPTYTLLGDIDKYMSYDELQQCLKNK